MRGFYLGKGEEFKTGILSVLNQFAFKSDSICLKSLIPVPG